MPQIILLIHAASVNRKKAGLDKRPNTGTCAEDYMSPDMPTYRGKPIDKLSTEEYQLYLNTL